jgi:drug/metabolite transporter (DMT)-like permease
LIVFVGSIIFLDEKVSEKQILAFFLLASGILSLSLRSIRSFAKHPQSLFFAIGTGMLIGSYTIVDGLGVRTSENVWAYISWLFFLEMVMVQIYCVYHYRGRTLDGLMSLGSSGIWAGILAAFAYGSVLWAYLHAPIMLVSALRETSVVIATLLGILFLKEDRDSLKILAAVLVAAGIILIKN